MVMLGLSGTQPWQHCFLISQDGNVRGKKHRRLSHDVFLLLSYQQYLGWKPRSTKHPAWVRWVKQHIYEIYTLCPWLKQVAVKEKWLFSLPWHLVHASVLIGSVGFAVHCSRLPPWWLPLEGARASPPRARSLGQDKCPLTVCPVDEFRL